MPFKSIACFLLEGEQGIGDEAWWLVSSHTADMVEAEVRRRQRQDQREGQDEDRSSGAVATRRQYSSHGHWKGSRGGGGVLTGARPGQLRVLAEYAEGGGSVPAL